MPRRRVILSPWFLLIPLISVLLGTTLSSAELKVPLRWIQDPVTGVRNVLVVTLENRNFLVDTGSESSFVSADLAQERGWAIRRHSAPSVAPPRNTLLSQFTSDFDISLLDRRVQLTRCHVYDRRVDRLFSDLEAVLGKPIDGLLGSDFLSQGFVVSIQDASADLRISSETAPTHGTPVRVALETGSDGSASTWR